MKSKLILVSLVVLILSSCEKKMGNMNDILTPLTEVPGEGEFIKYTIRKGEQYSDKNVLTPVTYKTLSFAVKFDSSAIYQNVLPRNQYDINKLFGFSDNNEHHHKFSARFGWIWGNNALRLFAYVYNNGSMSAKELGTVELGSVNNCSIEINNGTYIFTLNGKTETMPRASTTPEAVGYKLYPYFGGDELAPHTVSIWIKESAVL
jgi:hypothetical protein